MKRALIEAVLERRTAAEAARQRYDDASAGVDQDPLHNALARLEAADQLTEAAYELVNWVDSLLSETAWEHGGARGSAEDLADDLFVFNDGRRTR